MTDKTRIQERLRERAANNVFAADCLADDAEGRTIYQNAADLYNAAADLIDTLEADLKAARGQGFSSARVSPTASGSDLSEPGSSPVYVGRRKAR